MDIQKKRRRENWSFEEKEILRQLIAQSAHILENKNTNTKINLLKSKEWENVMKKFIEISGRNRSVNEIKLAWKRMKLAAKANLSTHRRQQLQTGGGEKPPSPSQEDLSVMSIAPDDFVIEINDYDSDAIPKVDTPIDVAQVTMLEATPSTSTQASQVAEKDTEPKIMQFVNLDPEPPKTQREPCKKKYKNIPQTISETMAISIAESNKEFKKKQIEFLEEEHKLNIQIAELKIKKLQLEIFLLEQKKSCNTP